MNRRTFLSTAALVPLAANVDLPITKPVFAGYLNVEKHRVWCAKNDKFILPYINGELTKECIAADSIEGWVECHAIRNGKVVLSGGDIVNERYYGKVEWRVEKEFPKGWRAA